MGGVVVSVGGGEVGETARGEHGADYGGEGWADG